MKKSFLALLFTFTLIVSACTSGNDSLFKEGIVEFINNEYRIYDTVNSATDASNFSEIYVAENQTIDEVATNITSHQQPMEQSEKRDDKRVLVYENLFVILTLDEENLNNTFIEVANQEFVRNNYSPDFFDGLFLLWVLNDLLDVDDWGKKRKQQCQYNPNACYGGYTTTGGFKGLNKTPTIRGGSAVRGGGPGAGK